MMNLGSAAHAISEDASGANGDLDFDERVRRACVYVGDWVFESLVNYRVVLRGSDQAAIRAATHLVATAMCTQHDVLAALEREEA